MSFETLVNDMLRGDIGTLQHEQSLPTYNLKFSGDGANVSRASNFVIFSVSIVSNDRSLSSMEPNVGAVLQCP